MKTFSAKNNSVKINWYYINASGKILGRLATQISKYLKGKHKPEYTPHVDVGDYIIVLNANKIVVTGKKKNNKIYFHHTGYIGGIKKVSFQEMLTKCPEEIIKHAVKGMLPKNSLGRKMFQKLKIYSGDQHKHTAQQPQLLIV
ncbi:50S ribosomal protein L13 [Buchnera aphidicola (Nipponaphis monzeni)]|uniref:Large ribosomal subunit protein uL13 n=1 Tax=Buchnera aphidicola (Nipponaphis monzeni) TaxID=2495405 RepID=A0A455TAG0_9GAMM|nr:50S ribosomal protein L13 [Buchnera aphidicola]BBI01309.1 50S ribosomal protein L13 [Buchnera aphidicola (Nipponaphis monzeni)]